MTLQETIEEKARIDRAYDTYSILDEAYKIKLIRIEKKKKQYKFYINLIRKGSHQSFK